MNEHIFLVCYTVIGITILAVIVLNIQFLYSISNNLSLVQTDSVTADLLVDNNDN